MSEPHAAGPDSGAGPAHRSRARRRAARPAGPPPAAGAAEPLGGPPAAEPPAQSADSPPATRTRTKPRHGAKAVASKDPTAPPPARSTPADQPAKAGKATVRASSAAQTKAQPPTGARRGRPATGRRDEGADAAWRDLAGGGPSKVGLSGALRARDVDRPTAEDLAEAERSVVIVRRDAPDQRVAAQNPAKQNASATGDAPARRGRRKRPSGSGV